MPERPQPSTGRGFRQKLGIYFVGLSIGLMLFGWFQVQKYRAVAKQRAEQVQPDPGTDPADSDGAVETTEGANSDGAVETTEGADPEPGG